MSYVETDAQANVRFSRPFLLNRNGRFNDRLKKALAGSSIRSFSQKSGVSETVLRAYLAGKSEPTRPALLNMANAADVNIAWLATGDGPMRKGDDTPVVNANLDVSLLQLVVEVIEEALDEEGSEMAPNKKAQLIAAVYDLYHESEAMPEKTKILRLVNLSA